MGIVGPLVVLAGGHQAAICLQGYSKIDMDLWQEALVRRHHNVLRRMDQIQSFKGTKTTSCWVVP